MAQFATKSIVSKSINITLKFALARKNANQLPIPPAPPITTVSGLSALYQSNP